jgi:hypothetical protein
MGDVGLSASSPSQRAYLYNRMSLCYEKILTSGILVKIFVEKFSKGSILLTRVTHQKRIRGKTMKRHFLRFSPVLFLFLTLLLWGNFSDAAVPWQLLIPDEASKPVETPAEKIVTDRDSYDGKKVSVKGSVSNLKFKTSKGGNNYTTFVLVGESGVRINVIISEHPKVKTGQKVRVTGVYRKVKKTAHRNYYNEIEASEVKAL